MSTREAVKIRRDGKQWIIQCTRCDDQGMLGLIQPAWIIAATHRTAVMLAAWHVDEHKVRGCDHCHRTDVLPRPKLIDTAHFEFDGKLYEARSDGIVAIGTAAKAAR